jgi:4'-phosphopantetheinyl transferase
MTDAAQAQFANVELGADEVHLWLSYYDAIEDERLHARYFELLNDQERVQQGRFYFARDRLRYLVTRALVRTVLSRYLPIAPGAWKFAVNSFGRPEIANTEAASGELRFNISHSQGLIVLAVTRSVDIGVDVENVEAREVSVDLAERFFAPEETAVLMAAPECEQQYRFFEYWTLKEAYIKARGMGLSLPLDKFSFHYPTNQTVKLATAAELDDDAERWDFWQLRPMPKYLIAACVQRSSHRQRLVVRECVPGHSERVVIPDVVRM